jgi:hypothetical protein
MMSSGGRTKGISFLADSEEQPMAAAVPARETALKKSRRDTPLIFLTPWEDYKESTQRFQFLL